MPGTKKQTWRQPGLHSIQLPKVDNFVWRCHRTILMILMTADNIQDKFCFKDTPPKRETQWKVTSNQSTTMSKTVRVEYIRIYPNYQTKSYFVLLDFPSARILLPPCKQPLSYPCSKHANEILRSLTATRLKVKNLYTCTMKKKVFLHTLNVHFSF